jgi:hypothetical protein
MSNVSYIIYITGKPGMGKYTIAKELRKFSFVLCDNQLINNPIFEMLNYDGFTEIPQFAWDSISCIRDIVLNFIEMEKDNNYVLTNNLYDDLGDLKLYEQVKKMSQKRGSVFVPVRLNISENEHLRRITEPSRRDRWKSIDPKDVYNKVQLLKIDHPNLLELDVDMLPPEEAAQKILMHAYKLK